jgi:hypothetical protein
MEVKAPLQSLQYDFAALTAPSATVSAMRRHHDASMLVKAIRRAIRRPGGPPAAVLARSSPPSIPYGHLRRRHAGFQIEYVSHRFRDNPASMLAWLSWHQYVVCEKKIKISRNLKFIR